jgi:hypothetical protein
MYVLVGIFAFEKKELCYDEVCQMVLYGITDEDDAVLEQPAVNVVGALPPSGLFDDIRNGLHEVTTHLAAQSSAGSSDSAPVSSPPAGNSFTVTQEAR